MIPEIHRVFIKNRRLYGARKVWRELKREGIDVSRYRFERLMRQEGLQGVIKGRKRPPDHPSRRECRAARGSG